MHGQHRICCKPRPVRTQAALRLLTGADTLLENLTVGEMLLYTAELKMPLQYSIAAKRERVAILLQQLALTPCRDVKIGGTMNKGISGVPPGFLMHIDAHAHFASESAKSMLPVASQAQTGGYVDSLWSTQPQSREQESMRPQQD